MTVNNALEQINLQIQWNRILSVVEEQAQVLVRTAFSTAAREAGDISAGVFDCDGRMLARRSPARRVCQCNGFVSRIFFRNFST